MTQMTQKLRGLEWESYAWLIYSVPFLLASFHSSFSTGETAAMIAGYGVFLIAYLAGQIMRGPRILWLMAVMNLLVIAFGTMNPGTGSFLIYGAAMSAHAYPGRGAVIALAVHVVIGTVIVFLLDLPRWYYMMPVLAVLIGAVTIQGVRNDANNAKLRVAQAEVERLAKLAERERIARDLHDVLGHTLSVVVLKSALAYKLITRDPARAAAEMAEVERIARDSLADVRQAITGYRSSGLAAELDHVRETLVAAGIQATIEAGTVSLAPAQETALSLALREATTNVIRHAEATCCHIRFSAREGSVLMEVQDNGRGGDAPFGNGLTGMRERIQALGGVLHRDAGHGTRLSILLPLRAEG